MKAKRKAEIGKAETGERVTLHTPHSSTAAFTMVEIAISLAIIGFALLAIIGILPFCMNVQRDNRQETIINQDATVWMDAICNGQQGLDDLTNYVLSLTNPVTGVFINNPVSGREIIGRLSTPRTATNQNDHFVASVRSLSGPASEKYPQNDPTVQGLALSYKLIADVVPCQFPPGSDPTNSFLIDNLTSNLYEVRLTFRWPILPNGGNGPGRQIFRTLVAGTLTNDAASQNLFFFQPRNYVKAQ